MIERPVSLLTALAFGVAHALRAQCPNGSPPPCVAAAMTTPSTTSVAVLTFDNRSRDTSDAFLAEGLADEIAVRLGHLGRITVISRSQVRRISNAGTMTVPALGRALNAVNLVTGSVQGSVNRLRVSVELMRASTAVQTWSNVYDRSRSDLLDIQSDIAEQICVRRGRVAPPDRTRTTGETRHHVVAGARAPDAGQRFRISAEH